MENALYAIEFMLHFASLKLHRLPDQTTILKFRHLLKRHSLGKGLFKEVNKHLEKNGLMLREGSIVDASIISASPSTKNESGKRDRIVGSPEMHQTRKGNQWYFGMKMHIGVDDTLGLIHNKDTTAANVHDIVPAGNLLHDDKRRVFGDAGYLGIQKRDEHKDRKDVSWLASVRAKVGHPFRYIAQVFGYSKVRYRSLAKASNRLHLLAAFGNLLMGEKYLSA